MYSILNRKCKHDHGGAEHRTQPSQSTKGILKGYLVTEVLEELKNVREMQIKLKIRKVEMVSPEARNQGCLSGAEPWGWKHGVSCQWEWSWEERYTG